MIKVLLADDHQIVLEGLSSLLKDEGDIQIVQEVYDGEQVLKVLKNEIIDVVILDIHMPRMDGLETTKKIQEQYPNTNVLILTMDKEPETILGLVDAGALGFVLKNRGKEELVQAVRKVSAGKKYLGDIVTEALLMSRNNAKKEVANKIILTRREKEVLTLITEGLTSGQIAEKLFISPSTVETHRRNVLDKTGALNSKALIRLAIELNLIEKSQ